MPEFRQRREPKLRHRRLEFAQRVGRGLERSRLTVARDCDRTTAALEGQLRIKSDEGKAA